MTVSFSRQIHNNVYGGLFANPNPSWLKKRPTNTKTHVKDWSTLIDLYMVVVYTNSFFSNLFMYLVFCVSIHSSLSPKVHLKFWTFNCCVIWSVFSQSCGVFQPNLAKDVCSHWLKCRYILRGEIIIKYLTIHRLKSPFSPDVNQWVGETALICLNEASHTTPEGN